MTFNLFLDFQLIIMGAVFALGMQLLFTNLPEELKGSRIDVASRILGLALTIIPVGTFIYSFSFMRAGDPKYAMAITISAYCMTSTLVAMAYYVLLDQLNDRLMIRSHLIIGLLFPFPLWVGLYYCSDLVDKHILIAAYTVFCLLVLTHIITCLYFYRKQSKQAEASLLTQMQEMELKLINGSIYEFLILVLIGILTPLYYKLPVWLECVTVSAFGGLAVYMYVCYRKILRYCIRPSMGLDAIIAEHKTLNEDQIEQEEIVMLSETVRLSIEKNLNAWLKKKEYVNVGVSISDVAKNIGTNRTYLSRYINLVYQCSFKLWITQLRIQESKQIMLKDSDISVAELATKVGFASVESFSHIFTRCETLSPTKWREKNCKYWG